MTIKCDKCGICCKLFLINLNEKEYKSARYKTQFGRRRAKDFEEAELCGDNILAQNFDGSCIYLKKGKCSIHDSRPSSCRKFFCKSKRKKFKKMIETINKVRGDEGKKIRVE